MATSYIGPSEQVNKQAGRQANGQAGRRLTATQNFVFTDSSPPMTSNAAAGVGVAEYISRSTFLFTSLGCVLCIEYVCLCSPMLCMCVSTASRGAVQNDLSFPYICSAVAFIITSSHIIYTTGAAAQRRRQGMWNT